MQTKNFTLYPTDSPKVLYFEHNRLGDSCAGHIWFDDDKSMIDYDGVFELPKEIVTYLKSYNYDTSYVDDILDDNELPHSK